MLVQNVALKDCNYNGGKVLRIASLVSTLVVVGKKEREDNNQRVLIQQH